MNKKKTILLSMVIFALLIPGVLAALDFSTIDNAIGNLNNLTNLYPAHKDAASFIIFFALFTALFWWGIQVAQARWSWPDGARNAMTVVAFALGAGASLGVLYWQRANGKYIIDMAGSLFMLIAILLPLAILGWIFYRESNDEASTPWVWAAVILFVYYLINAFIPNFSDHLGPLGAIIELFALLASAVLILGLLRLVWDALTNVMAGFGGRSALSERRMNETTRHYQQRGRQETMKRTLGSQKAATTARKEERKIRKTIQREDKDLKEAEKILGELHQAVAQKKPQLITGNWRKWKGELKKLEQLQTRIGGYIGIIDGVVNEVVDMTGVRITRQRDELLGLSSNLLASAQELEETIRTINQNVRRINNSVRPSMRTGVGSRLWTQTLNAISEASNILTNVHRDTLGARALEKKVREQQNIA